MGITTWDACYTTGNLAGHGETKSLKNLRICFEKTQIPKYRLLDQRNTYCLDIQLATAKANIHYHWKTFLNFLFPALLRPISKAICSRRQEGTGVSLKKTLVMDLQTEEKKL